MAKPQDSNAAADGSAGAIAALVPSPCTTRGPENWQDVHVTQADQVFYLFQLCASPGSLVVTLDDTTRATSRALVPFQPIDGAVKVMLPPLERGKYNLVWSFAVPPGVPWQSVAEISVKNPASTSEIVQFRKVKTSTSTHPNFHGFARIEVPG